MTEETPIVVDHAAIAAAAMRDGLPNTVIVDGAVSAPVQSQALQDEYARMFAEQEAGPASSFPAQLHVVEAAPLAPIAPTGLGAQLDALIDQRVADYRDSLIEHTKRAIEQQLDELGHSNVAEARMSTRQVPMVRRPLVEQQQRDGDVARPGTCVVEAWDDGAFVHVMCGHQISWAEGANFHATGDPQEGFACEECLTGQCGHAKAPAVESGEATFPLHE